VFEKPVVGVAEAVALASSTLLLLFLFKYPVCICSFERIVFIYFFIYPKSQIAINLMTEEILK